jgi:Lar family restriction alleviation protein
VSEELKPCPFCGGSVKIEFVQGNWGYTNNMVHITCKKCHIGFHEKAEKWEQGKGTYSIEKEARKKLFNKWNTRYA